MVEFGKTTIFTLKIQLEKFGREFHVDLNKGIDISIPLDFHGEQPNTYGVPFADAKAYEDGVFIGDTRRGGSCNFEEYKLIPHCNGTHTECIGHISLERISVHTLLTEGLIPAVLVTVAPVNALKSTDSYIPQKNAEDHLITKASFEKSVERFSAELEFIEALIIRTLPNDQTKFSRNYLETPPPFFSIEAMTFIKNAGIKHLLVDIPSIDRMFDDGLLTNHHIFWDVPQNSHDVDPKNHSHNTITEMIYVPDAVEDGMYFLNLQIASFVADAAPSRPVIFKIEKIITANEQP